MRRLALIFALAACTSPELTRRYKSAEWVEVPASKRDDYVRLALLVRKGETSKAKSLLERLDAEGQAAFIQASQSFSASFAQFIDTLDESAPDGRTGTLDRTKFQKRLVISIEKRLDAVASRKVGKGQTTVKPLISPADRISRLSISLSALTDGKFTSWQRYASAFAEVDLGKITLNKKTTGELSISAGPKAGNSLPVSGGGSLSFSRDLKEELSLRQRYEVLTPILTPTDTTLLRHGVVGIDLSGTMVFDVTLRSSGTKRTYHVIRVARLFQGGAPLPPNRISIQELSVTYVQQSDVKPITCTLQAGYELRTVTRGERTVAEGDDRATYLVGSTTPTPTTLVKASELRVKLYIVKTRAGHPVRIAGVGDAIFASYQEAQAFTAWSAGTVWSTPPTVGPHALTANLAPLTVAEARDMAVDTLTIN